MAQSGLGGVAVLADEASEPVHATKRYAIYRKTDDGSPAPLLGVQEGRDEKEATSAAIRAYGLPYRSLIARSARDGEPSPTWDGGRRDRPLTKAEADRICEKIRGNMTSARDLLVELYEGRGWEAMGYKSWRECAAAEFGEHQRTLYKQLEAAKVARELDASQDGLSVAEFGNKSTSANMKSADVPDSQLIALAKAPEGSRAEVLRIAMEASDGKPTEAVVRAAVEAKKAAPDAATAELVKATAEAASKSKAPPRTVVNGEAKEDAGVERLRAKGMIPADALVTVEQPEVEVDMEALREEIEERSAIADAEMSDEDWLATLPLTSKLTGISLDIFRRDALLWRRMSPHRRVYAKAAAKELKASRKGTVRSTRGQYASKLEWHLSFEDPSRWLVCPPVDKGGCGGCGQVTLIGRCPKCHETGYIVPKR